MEVAERVKGRLLFSGQLVSILYAQARLEPPTLAEKRAMINTLNVLLDIDDKISNDNLRDLSIIKNYEYYLSHLKAKKRINDEKEKAGNLLLAHIDELKNALKDIKKKDENEATKLIIPNIVSILNLLEKENDVPILNGARMHDAITYWLSELKVPRFSFFDKIYRGPLVARKLKSITQEIQQLEKIIYEENAIDDKEAREREIKKLKSDAMSYASKLGYYSYEPGGDLKKLSWRNIKKEVEKRAALESTLVNYLSSLEVITEGAKKTTLYIPLRENNLYDFAKRIATYIINPAKYKLSESTICKLIELVMEESNEEEKQFEKFVEIKREEVEKRIAEVPFVDIWLKEEDKDALLKMETGQLDEKSAEAKGVIEKIDVIKRTKTIDDKLNAIFTEITKILDDQTKLPDKKCTDISDLIIKGIKSQDITFFLKEIHKEESKLQILKNPFQLAYLRFLYLHQLTLKNLKYLRQKFWNVNKEKWLNKSKNKFWFFQNPFKLMYWGCWYLIKIKSSSPFKDTMYYIYSKSIEKKYSNEIEDHMKRSEKWNNFVNERNKYIESCKEKFYNFLNLHKKEFDDITSVVLTSKPAKEIDSMLQALPDEFKVREIEKKATDFVELDKKLEEAKKISKLAYELTKKFETSMIDTEFLRSLKEELIKISQWFYERADDFIENKIKIPKSEESIYLLTIGMRRIEKLKLLYDSIERKYKNYNPIISHWLNGPKFFFEEMLIKYGPEF